MLLPGPSSELLMVTHFRFDFQLLIVLFFRTHFVLVVGNIFVMLFVIDCDREKVSRSS